MKIAVITDVHANLPALKVALDAIQAQRVDRIYHLGDAIAIGPYPAECVDRIAGRLNMSTLLGNHELYFLRGVPAPQPAWMSDGEVQHQRWTHHQLGERRRSVIASWQMRLEEEIEGVQVLFIHYGLSGSGDDFYGEVRHPQAVDLDRVFAAEDAQVIFFGHDHTPVNLKGRAHYVNPGSLGCQPKALACYITAEFEAGQVRVQHHAVSYDDWELYRAFEERDVPERVFIYKAFFGGRFAG
jgi:predicted phosphodiesterase